MRGFERDRGPGQPSTSQTSSESGVWVRQRMARAVRRRHEKYPVTAASEHGHATTTFVKPQKRSGPQAQLDAHLDGSKLRQWLDKQYKNAPAKVAADTDQGRGKFTRPEERLGQALVDLPDTADLGQVLEGQPLKSRHITRLLSYVGKHGSPDRALATFMWLDERPKYNTRDCFIYTRLMSLFGRDNAHAQTALQIFDRMQAAHVQPDLVAFNAAISAAGKAGEWSRMMAVLKSMRAGRVQPDVYTFTSLIRACQSCGNRWQSAIDFFDQMQQAGVQANVQAYTAVVSVCTHAGQLDQALSLLHAMDAAGIQADARAFNSVIAACAARGQWESAWAVMAAMQRSGVAPTTVSFNLLLSACERANQPDRVLEVFGRMQRIIRGTNGSLYLSLVTYNTVLSACAKAGMFDRAMQLYKQMKAEQLQPDIFTLTSLINACDQANRGWQLPVQLAHDFQRQGVRLNTVAVNLLIHTLGKAGEWQQAMELLEGMKRQSANPDLQPNTRTYSNLIAACRTGHQHALAVELYHEMQDRGLQPNSYVFDTMLAVCKAGSLWQDGLDILKTMQAREDIRSDGLAMAALETLFRNPALASAAWAAFDSGRATRRWIDHH